MDTVAGRCVVYDLTEVLLASTGRLPYHGIVQVVAQIGVELFKQDPSVRFAFFSQAHGEFFEVFPSRQADGSVNLNVPIGIRQFRMRHRFYTKSLLRDSLLNLIRPVMDLRNRRIWAGSRFDLTPINIDGKTLVSCGRPKLIVDMLEIMDRKNISFHVVPLLHDMFPLYEIEHKTSRFPRNFIGDNQVLIPRAKAILTNSEFTRNEILAFSEKGMLPEIGPIFAVPLAHECLEGTEPAAQPLPQEPYLLMVGSSLGRKNLEVVFDTLRVLKAQGQQVPTLVLAGALRKRTEKYLQSAQGEDIRDYVTCRENPNQTDLINLYRNALALVLPSRLEGWGLPAGEALWVGTPAICSTAVVLREVCGENGLYFDPDQPEQLADLIIRLMTQPDFTEQLRSQIAAAKPQLRTWADVARDLRLALQK